jgi:metal-responsive CopG/Arc/MetJ family transcriptional regulator
MKTVVPIPAPLFHAAESLAKRLGISRSELFSQALNTYIEIHGHDQVREALDEIYAEEPSGLDEGLASIQWASLTK